MNGPGRRTRLILTGGRDGTFDDRQRQFPLPSTAGAHRPRPAACRTRAHQGLQLLVLGAGRVPLPPPADLLGLCRRGDFPLRAVGGRLDDAGAAVPLSSVRNRRARFRAAAAARAGALVSALALWPLAWNQLRAEITAVETGGPLFPPGIDTSVPGPVVRNLAARYLLRTSEPEGHWQLQVYLPFPCRRSRRRCASLDPSSAARSYQALACTTSGAKPRTPCSARKPGSNVTPSASAAGAWPALAARRRINLAEAMSPFFKKSSPRFIRVASSSGSSSWITGAAALGGSARGVTTGVRRDSFFGIHSSRTNWLSIKRSRGDRRSIAASMTPTKSLGAKAMTLPISRADICQPVKPSGVPADSLVPVARPTSVSVSAPDDALTVTPSGIGSLEKPLWLSTMSRAGWIGVSLLDTPSSNGVTTRASVPASLRPSFGKLTSVTPTAIIAAVTTTNSSRPNHGTPDELRSAYGGCGTRSGSSDRRRRRSLTATSPSNGRSRAGGRPILGPPSPGAIAGAPTGSIGGAGAWAAMRGAIGGAALALPVAGMGVLAGAGDTSGASARVDGSARTDGDRRAHCGAYNIGSSFSSLRSGVLMIASPMSEDGRRTKKKCAASSCPSSVRPPF